MLGNFSVGDYFKAEVIPWAWELATSPWPQGLGLDKDRIWTTIFLDDEESFELWRRAGVPAERIVRFGEKENYWFSGPVGPCGPNSEINYDFGADKGCLRPECAPNCENPMDGGGECDRFLEFWNLVFMTLYQAEDGTRTDRCRSKNVDTGAGFERWVTLKLWQDGVDWQGKPEGLAGPERTADQSTTPTSFSRSSPRSPRSPASPTTNANFEEQRAMRIVADHARAATFLIAEGLSPSNEGRGYVLRRLIRRATTFGQKLKPGEQFMARTAEAIIGLMKPYHELLDQRANFVIQALRAEEARFFDTLGSGRAQIADFMRQHPDKQIAGKEVFFLWDTHGFPPELTLELLAEEGFSVSDIEAFERELDAQRERSRAASRFEGDAERIQAYAELQLAPHGVRRLRDDWRRPAACRRSWPKAAPSPRSKPPRRTGPARRGCPGHHPLLRRGRRPGRRPRRADRLARGGRVRRRGHAGGRRGWCRRAHRPAGGGTPDGRPRVEARVDAGSRADTMRNHTARTSCTPPCARCWAATCARPAPTSAPTACASTSPTWRR